MDIGLTQHHLGKKKKKTIFSPLQCNVTIVINQVTIYMWDFYSISISILLIYLSVFTPVPHYFN